MFLNYRPSSRAVYRASIWTSYTRPPFLQLGGGASTSVGVTIAPGTNIQVQTTTINKGNPNLKSIGALNLDASGEWDSGQGGHLMLAGFYKHLTNYIYDGGSNAGVVSATGVGTITRQPVNGGSGSVYGVEIAARQKFSAMPAPLDGLGVAGNFTYQHTRVDVLGDGTRIDRIQNAPDFLGNAQLFFERGPFGFDINYDYSGRYVSIYDTLGMNATWDDVWVRPVGRLDLHAGYAFTQRLKLDASISNVLKATSYWAHIGKDTYTISDIVNSGSTSLLTLTYKM